MNQSEGRAKGLFAVLIAVCLSLLAARYCMFGGGLQPESIDRKAPDADPTDRFHAIDKQRDERQNQTELVQYVESCLQPTLPRGGYFLNQDVLDFDDDEWDAARKVPRIRAVEGMGFSPVAWTNICQLGDLESLNNRYENVTNDDLQNLARLSKLKVLILQTPVGSSQPEEYFGREPPFSAVALEPLKDMDQLRQLTLASDRLLDDGLAQVKLVPHLLLLHLTGHLTNEGLKHLGELPEIRRLWLSGHFDDDGLIYLANLETLETLALRSDRLTGRGLAHLAKLPNLRHLIIHGLQPGWTLAPLKDFTALEVLNLGRDGLTDEILGTLPHSDRIQSLCLDSAYDVTNQGLECLLHLPNLEELDLLHTGITCQGFETVSKCQNLRKLLLGLHRSSESAQEIQQGLAYLSRLPKLKALDLRYVLRAGAFLEVLDIPTLRKLNLDDDRFQEQVKQLRERSPLLDPVTTERITIRAQIIGDSSFWQYDYLDNRMKVDID